MINNRQCCEAKQKLIAKSLNDLNFGPKKHSFDDLQFLLIFVYNLHSLPLLLLPIVVVANLNFLFDFGQSTTFLPTLILQPVEHILPSPLVDLFEVGSLCNLSDIFNRRRHLSSSALFLSLPCCHLFLLDVLIYPHEALERGLINEPWEILLSRHILNPSHLSQYTSDAIFHDESFFDNMNKQRYPFLNQLFFLLLLQFHLIFQLAQLKTDIFYIFFEQGQLLCVGKRQHQSSCLVQFDDLLLFDLIKQLSDLLVFVFYQSLG